MSPWVSPGSLPILGTLVMRGAALFGEREGWGGGAVPYTLALWWCQGPPRTALGTPCLASHRWAGGLAEG